LLDSPEFDDARLAAMLDMAKVRSRALGHRQHLRRSITGLAALVLLLGTAGALLVQPQNGTGTPHRASSGSHRTIARAPAWKLVGDVTRPSWQEEPSLSGSGRGYGLVCPTATACYMLEEDQSSPSGPSLTSIEVTQDGGSTWQQTTLPSGDSASTGLACVGADTCMAGGADSGGNAVLLTTDDAGQTWTSLPGPSQLAPSLLFLDLSCRTAQSCIAITQGLVVDASGSQTYDIILTTDGGQTWSSSPLPSDFVPLEARCLGGSTCIVGGFDAASGDVKPSPQSQGAVFASTDGGASWAAATVPDGFGPVTTFSCGDQADCVAVTAGTSLPTSQVIATADGGQTWTAAAGAGLPTSYLQAVACLSSSYCWAAGVQLSADDSGSATPISLSSIEGVVAMTNDGGHNWQTTQLPAGLSDHSVVTAVACPTSTVCFATVWLPTASSQGQYVLLSYDSSGT